MAIASSATPGFRRATVGALLACLLADPAAGLPGRWTALGPWGLNDGGTFALAPSQPSRIYIAPDFLPVQRSDDRGETWGASGAGYPLGAYTSDLDVSPHDPASVLSVVGGSVYRTSDAGGTWTPPAGGALPPGLRSIVVDPVQSARAFAGGVGAISMSTDGGTSWAATGTGLDGAGQIVHLVMHAARPDQIVALTSSSLHRSTDAGATWSTILPSVTAATDVGAEVAWSASDETVLVVALNGHGVLRSTDAGATFTVRPFESGITVEGLAIHPTAPGTIHVLCTNFWSNSETDLELRSSADGGASWGMTYQDVQSCWQCYAIPLDLAIDPAAPQHLYFTKRDWQSPGRGRGFMRSSSGPAGPWTAKVQGIAGLGMERVTNSLNGEILARPFGRYGLYHAFPPYTEWQAFPGTGDSRYCQVLQAATSGAGRAVEATECFGCDYVLSTLRLRRAAGGPWYEIAEDDRFQVAQRYTSGTRLYYWGYSTFHRNSAGEWLFESLPSPWGMPTAAAIHPESDDRLLAAWAGAAPLKESTDAGSTWRSISAGLPPGTIISILLDPNRAEHLAVAYSAGSPWESTDGGETWEERPVDPPGTGVEAADWIPSTGNILLATTRGVISTRWGEINEGLPRRRVSGIAYDAASRTVFVTGERGGVFSRRLNAPVGIIAEALIDRTPSVDPGAPPDRADLLRVDATPFRGEVDILFSVPAGRTARLSIHDVAGRRIRSVDLHGTAGQGRWTWDARSDSGSPTPPGVYFIRLDSDHGSATRKVVHLP